MLLHGSAIILEMVRIKFDLIIMDALDRDKFVEIVGAFYNNNQFVCSLYNGLADDELVSFYLMSIMQMPHLSRTNAFIFPQVVVQIGESQDLDKPSLELGRSKDKAHMVSGNGQ
jgi:hypothetical protein